ncbi:MAG: protein-disulfide reductase DsbD family protein, partial [Bdellovibrionales bacterium]
MKNIRHFIVALILCTLTLSPFGNAKAQEQQVQITLMAERNTVGPGDEIWIGTQQTITPHWHTYWRNPGDSGTATRIQWDLPDGFEIAEIDWPTPQKLPFGPLLNYGFENNATLLQKLKIPQTLPDGPITLTADIELLVCKETCVPEYGTYTLTLNDPQAPDIDNTAQFEEILKTFPQTRPFQVEFSEHAGDFTLQITMNQDDLTTIQTETLDYFPHEWGIIDNAAPVDTSIKDGKLRITQKRGERGLDSFETLDGVITYMSNDGTTHSIAIRANKAQTATAPKTQTQTQTQPTIEKESPAQIEAPDAPTDSEPPLPLWNALLFALFGGLILNLMPCVFPVLSIKALSLVKMADKHPGLAKAHGLSYTAGVILSFLAIAGLLLILKAAGAQIGWGFQLQNPIVIASLAALLFIIGLNLMGFFEFSFGGANIGQKLTAGHGLSASFFTGILATLVATPCTAPFMAGAIGFALTQTAIVNLLVFTALGFGLALPYLALSFIPALQHILPKPGVWMNTFKEFLAFPMFLSSVWLIWVLSQQAGPIGVLQSLIAITSIVFSIWAFRHKNGALKFLSGIAALGAIAFIIMIPSAPMDDPAATAQKTPITHQFGEPFSQTQLNDLLKNDPNPVFVEMTAAWCITCKVNHAVAINIDSTKELFKNNKINYLIGDWTNKDEEITQYL